MQAAQSCFQIDGVQFCINALEEALNRYGHPDIFNTDQGSLGTCSVKVENYLLI